MKKVIRLTESDLAKLVRRIIKENEELTNENRIYQFLNDDDIKKDTGVWSFETCDEDDWDKVKNYISGKGINGVTGKGYFLYNNEDITEEEFDFVYDAWVDNIDEQRGFDNMNQRDFNY